MWQWTWQVTVCHPIVLQEICTLSLIMWRMCAELLKVCDWKGLFIPVIIPQSYFCQLKHFLIGLWWHTELSSLMICEINSHSSAAKDILHHRPQHGWVEQNLYSSVLCIFCIMKLKSHWRLFIFAGGDIAGMVSVSVMLCQAPTHPIPLSCCAFVCSISWCSCCVSHSSLLCILKWWMLSCFSMLFGCCLQIQCEPFILNCIF